MAKNLDFILKVSVSEAVEISVELLDKDETSGTDLINT